MIIISAVGADRPGIVHAIANELVHAGCTVEDTTMTRLGGEFAMIFLVSPPAGTTAENLRQHLAPIGAEHDIAIDCKAHSDARSTPDALAGARYAVSVYGAQSTPLLAHITGVLAEHSVNITDLQSRMASERNVYVMSFEVEVPPQVSAGVLRSALEAAAAEVEAQVSLNPLSEEDAS